LIFAAKKGATNAARYAVIIGSGINRNAGFPWLWHNVLHAVSVE